MLHANTHRKTKISQRYLPSRHRERDRTEQRTPQEDEITSTIFGPLDFMQPADVWTFVSALLANSGVDSTLPKTDATQCQIDFWKHFKLAGRNYVEPEIVFTFSFEKGAEVKVILEVKWFAKLSGKNQLIDQWNCLSKEEKQSSYHIFLVREYTDTGKWGPIWENESGRPLLQIYWSSLRNVIEKISISEDDTPLGRWATLADNFLKSVNVKHFDGFPSCSVDCLQYLDKQIYYPTIYWLQTRSDPLS